MIHPDGPGTGRPPSFALRGMVATPHALASAAGLEMLHRGGSAVDAAIAANAVLCVVYPHMAGLGGDGFWLIAGPGAGGVQALNASGPAARAATVELYREHGSEIPARGPLAAHLQQRSRALRRQRFRRRGFALHAQRTHARPRSIIGTETAAARRRLLEVHGLIEIQRRSSIHLLGVPRLCIPIKASPAFANAPAGKPDVASAKAGRALRYSVLAPAAGARAAGSAFSGLLACGAANAAASAGCRYDRSRTSRKHDSHSQLDLATRTHSKTTGISFGCFTE